MPNLFSGFVSGWFDSRCQKSQLVVYGLYCDPFVESKSSIVAMMTDPIADLLTRIRNAMHVERPYVDMPTSRMKVHIVEALQREGFVWDHEIVEEEGSPCPILRVNLKYGPNGEHVIQHIERISKPGCRVYVSVAETKEVRDGLGISVLSTSRGVLSNREARKEGVGGELLCQIW